MFVYSQKTGEMWSHADDSGTLGAQSVLIGTGYSGMGEGKNNPAMESVRSVGPIPRGSYEIGPIYDTQKLGPRVMPVTPIGHDALGRSGFFIHGDNATHDASHGCIILPRTARELIGGSEDNLLKVI